MKYLRLLSLLVAVLVLAGCPPADDKDGEETPTPTPSPTPTATPTPAPSSISLVLADDPNGTDINYGECVAFDVIGDATTTFTTAFAIQIDYNDGAFSQVIPDVNGALPMIQVENDQLAHIGIPRDPNSSPCWCFGPGVYQGCEAVPAGPIDILIQDDAGAPFTLENVLNLLPAAPTALVDGTPANGQLDRQADRAYYGTLGINPTHTLVTARPNGATTWLPITYGYPGPSLGAYDGLLSLGSRSAARDFAFVGASWDYYPTVSDNLLGGGAGYDFVVELEQTTPTDITGGAIADTWHDGGGVNDNPNLMDLRQNGTNTYLATVVAAANDHNPSPTADPADSNTWPTTCVGQDNPLTDPVGPHFPLFGRGPDVVYLWDASGAAANQDVLLALQSEGDGANQGSGDFTMYIVEDPANNLPNGANGTCVAAGDLFGDIATDTLIFTAVAGTKYYIFIDTFSQVNGLDEFYLTTKTLN